MEREGLKLVNVLRKIQACLGWPVQPPKGAGSLPRDNAVAFTLPTGRIVPDSDEDAALVSRDSDFSAIEGLAVVEP